MRFVCCPFWKTAVCRQRSVKKAFGSKRTGGILKKQFQIKRMSLVCFVNPLIPIGLQPCHMPRSQWLGETVRWAGTKALQVEKYDWYTWQTPSGHGYKKIYLHFSIAPCFHKIKHSVLIFTVCTKKVYGLPLFPLKIRPDRKKWGKIKKTLDKSGKIR